MVIGNFAALNMSEIGMGWECATGDWMEWNRMGRDGMGQDGMGLDGTGWDGMRLGAS